MTATEGTRAAWIAVDWGTTRLRAWAMDGGTVLAHAASDDGMGRLARDGFEPALLRLVEPWLRDAPLPVIACGMVGSRQGWHEAPYRAVPCTPLDPAALAAPPVSDPRITVRLAPGLCQRQPADVMRGEETQIAGALALDPGFDGILCLPGTHSKWVEVSAGEVVSFRTFLTGELFDLLSRQSVLRHGLAEGWDDDAFAEGLSETLSRPERLASALFGIRAEGLLQNLPGAAARARLSGLLIGAELAAARPYWLGRPVAILGTEGLARAYAGALARQGVPARLLDATACTLAGLAALHRNTPETTA